MSIDRNVVRSVLPPVLALGLAALVVRPLATMAPPSPDAAAQSGAPVAAAPSGPVAFAPEIRVVDGRITTSVLVAAGQATGRATVVGAAGCVVAAPAGVATALDCAAPSGTAPVTVQVTLADGRVFTHTETATATAS